MEPTGVVGLVTDVTGSALAAGVVTFVPAADVAALPATTIATTSADDEPLEDLIASHSEYQQAVIGSDGRYVLPDLVPGSYFVTFTPDPDDEGHLPGGNLCRIALDAAGLIGTRVDLRVSTRPPAGAEFVGSGRCVTCHGRAHVADTTHRLGIWSPYEAGWLQNMGSRYDDLWMALQNRFTEAGTTIYYYDFDGSRKMDKYRTSETDPRIANPSANLSFTVTVQKTGPSYEMLLANIKDPGDGPYVYRVDAVYGGGVLKQRYLTKVDSPNGFFYAVLPAQFQHEGAETSGYGRTSKVWRDYNGGNWYNEDTLKLKAPTPAKSFEKNCISCHAVGTQVTGSDATTWRASLVSDPLWGDWDYDGDGVKDEVNIGCETCHGPGSTHWAAAGQGKAIVSPSLLTPEREAMICGQCHSRPKGGFQTDSPVSSDGTMMIAGTSRAEFLEKYATSQLDGSADDFYGDAARHSKSHHQQYSDFIRSRMYKNGTYLMVCSDCHDPHQRPNPRQLRADPSDNASLCGSACHNAEAEDLAGHLNVVLTAGIGSLMATAKCTDCHMPKTAKTGAGRPGIVVGTDQYWQNDVSSHIFDAPDKTVSRKTTASPAGFDMPTGYTSACAGSCHAVGP